MEEDTIKKFTIEEQLNQKLTPSAHIDIKVVKSGSEWALIEAQIKGGR